MRISELFSLAKNSRLAACALAAFASFFIAPSASAQASQQAGGPDPSTACERRDADGCYQYALVLQRRYYDIRSNEDQAFRRAQDRYYARREEARQEEQRRIRERRARMKQYERQGGLTGILIGGAVEASTIQEVPQPGAPPSRSSAASRAAYARMESTAIRSCELGSGPGCSFSGALVKATNADRSFDYYRRSCTLGYMPGCETSGRTAYQQLKDGKGGATAMLALREGCAQKAGLSCWDLGYFYSIGTGIVAKDMDQAIVHWQAACDLGYGGPCTAVARHKFGNSRSKAVLDLNLKACLAPFRSVDSACGVAYGYLSGSIKTDALGDPKLASVFAEDLCGTGKQNFCGFLSRDYRLGRAGRQIDELQATALLERACAEGTTFACVELADLMVTAKSLKTSPAMRQTIIEKNCATSEQASACASAANSSSRQNFVSEETRDIAFRISCENGGGLGCYFQSRQALARKDSVAAFALMEKGCSAKKSYFFACSLLVGYLAGDSELGKEFANWPRRSSLLGSMCSEDPEKNRYECTQLAVDQATGRYGTTMNRGRGLATLRANCKPDVPTFVYPCVWLSNLLYDPQYPAEYKPEEALALLDRYCGTKASARRCSSTYSGMRKNREAVSRPWHVALNIKLCNQESAWGCLFAANAYKSGDGVEADLDQAIALTERGIQLAPDHKSAIRILERWKAERDGKVTTEPEA